MIHLAIGALLMAAVFFAYSLLIIASWAGFQPEQVQLFLTHAPFQLVENVRFLIESAAFLFTAGSLLAVLSFVSRGSL